MTRSIDTTLLRGSWREQEPMSRHTSWKTGGSAEYFYKVADAKDLSTLLLTLPREMDIIWLGLGSNVLVRDGGINGLVVSVVGALNEMVCPSETTLKFDAGVTCAKASRYATKQKLSGLEFLASIPGSIGGALAMNAGAYGNEIWDCVKSVQTINRQAKVNTYRRDQFQTAYRSVSLADDEWFVGCTLELEPLDQEIIEKNIKTILAERAEVQPIGQHSCGSVFRNPVNDYAARLIEKSGLKGEQVGGAVVSKKHANFIINTGAATASDIEQLIELIQLTVFKQQGIELFPEVKIIGEVSNVDGT